MKHISRQAEHCRRAARTHGVYAADKYSIRAYLRMVDVLLMRIEAAVAGDATITLMTAMEPSITDKSGAV